MTEYRYNKSDFAPRSVKLLHVDLILNFLDDRVECDSHLQLSTLKPLDRITLDANDLEIVLVELATVDSSTPLQYEYRQEAHELIISLPEKIPAGESLTIHTRTVCTPSDNILEGIYKDTTPDGCPQQYMSQCQQWGFQRLSPIVDDCTAKCTFRTTMEGDARYTHLISNGNICKDTNPEGCPVPKPGDASRQLITYENDIPMAPYLFIACAGTWDTLTDEIVYPSGRKVRLEYLVPPGRVKDARVPMEILKASIIWQGETQEYEYTRDAYRTICMEKSNFGGMENVGNTTIITSAALIDKFTSDRRLEYAYGVIVHEFEHNQCGSDVTMETPFDMWLNEAFTVDVERQFMMSQFDPTCTTLNSVDAMRAPISGPLAIEDAGHMGNIVREGFNDPDELVDGVTYVKAAEVIGMLKRLLGPEVFRKAKNNYFAQYDGANANTDQFFKCFEEASGRDLSQFKKEWLYRIGYPQVTASHAYEESTRTLRVVFEQDASGDDQQDVTFHIPMVMAGVDEDGQDIPGTDIVFELNDKKQEATFLDVQKPAFISYNRDCSFYGTFRDKNATHDSLVKQVRLDPNRFNRVEAMRHLTDAERIKLVKNADAGISKDWLETYGSLIVDPDISAGLKAYMLRIDESSMDRTYMSFYRERYHARRKLLAAVADRYMSELLAVFHQVDTYAPAEQPRDGIEERSLKANLLRTITEANTSDSQRLAEDHFHRAWNISDKVSALSCINISDHPERLDILREARELWQGHLSAYTSYLAVVSSGIHDDVFDMIKTEEDTPPFTIQHPSHNRVLYLPMAANNRMLWTDQGIQWVADTVIKMATINENTAIRLVACFQQVRNLGDDLRPKVIDALKTMQDGIDKSAAPSIAGRIAAYLSD